MILVRNTTSNLFGGDETTLSAPETEMLNYINRRKTMNERTTLTDLRNHFNGKPFGWKMIASFCIVAELFKRGKVEAKQATNTLDDKQFSLSLNNNQQWNNTLIIPQQDIDGTLLRRIKDLHKDLFHDTNTATEAKEIAKNFKEKARELDAELIALVNQKDAYPFLGTVQPFKDKLRSLLDLDYSQLITTVHEYDEDLLDFKEDVLDKIRGFMNSEQINIYKNIGLFLNTNNGNLRFIDGESEIDLLKTVKSHPSPYIGDQIRTAKDAMDVLGKRILEAQDEERSKTILKLDEKIKNLKQESDFGKLTDGQKEQVLRPFSQYLADAKREPLISNIRDYGNNLSDLYTKQLNLCVSLANPPRAASGETTNNGTQAQNQAQVAEPRATYVTLSNTLRKVNTDVSRLETEEDVENYIQALKTALLDQLKQNHKINLN